MDHALTHGGDGLGDVGTFEQLVALLVDDLALVVGDVVELQQLLADIEVTLLDLALCGFERAGHHAVLDGLAFGHLEANHDGVEAVAGKDAHQRIFERQVETALARIALTTGPAAQLVVDTARFVTLGTDDLEAARSNHLCVQRIPLFAQRFGRDGFLLIRQGLIGHHRIHLLLDVAAEHDVGTATGHVGGDGDHAGSAGLGDDLRFLFVLLGVEHLVRQPGLDHQLGQQLGALDGGGAHQHRLAALLAVLDVFNDGVELFLHGAIDLVVLVFSLHRTVGRNHHRLEAVDRLKFKGFGIGRTGHASELAVHAEVVLEGDRGQGLVLGLDLHAFLGLDGLMQAFGPATPRHQTAGEFVDDDDFAVLHHVLLILVEQRMAAKGGVQVVHQQNIGRVVQRGAFRQQAMLGEDVFCALVTGFGQQHLMRLEIDGVVARLGDVVALADLLFEQRGNGVHLEVQVGMVFGLAGDDQWRAGLVDQDRVHFVDHREAQGALNALCRFVLHVVAQVVETEFVVGTVGDVGGVGGEFLSLSQLRHVNPHRQTEEAIQLPHPLRITTGQIVVDRDDMHALAAQRVEVHRQRGHQGLALTGAHLGDLAVVQHHAADELDVEVAHAVDPFAGFANHRERFGQNAVQRLALANARLEDVGLGSQVGVGQCRHLGFERIDRPNRLRILANEPIVAATEYFL